MGVVTAHLWILQELGMWRNDGGAWCDRAGAGSAFSSQPGKLASLQGQALRLCFSPAVGAFSSVERGERKWAEWKECLVGWSGIPTPPYKERASVTSPQASLALTPALWLLHPEGAFYRGNMLLLHCPSVPSCLLQDCVGASLLKTQCFYSSFKPLCRSSKYFQSNFWKEVCLRDRNQNLKAGSDYWRECFRVLADFCNWRFKHSCFR